jgi:hypothetical protein
VNITRTIVEPGSPVPGPSLGTCSLAESRIHRSRRIVEPSREKVAAPASPSPLGLFLIQMQAVVNGGPNCSRSILPGSPPINSIKSCLVSRIP